MFDNDVTTNKDQQVSFRQVNIRDLYMVDSYLFIKLSNGQNILTNGIETYDFSEYTDLKSIFTIEGKTYGVFLKSQFNCVIDIKTKEIIFEDEDVMHIEKENDNALFAIMKPGKGYSKIYIISKRKYLSTPDNYRFEESLTNDLYVFGEIDDNKDFYKRKRFIINSNDQIILSNIEGYVNLSKDYLIISRREEITIIKLMSQDIIEIKTLKKGIDGILNVIGYYDNSIIVTVKGAIRIYSPSLDILHEYKIEGLTKTVDTDLSGDILKICLPHSENGKKVNKHLFINIKNGKCISHLRIEEYPKWNPAYYIAKDSVDNVSQNYYFYDTDFNLIRTIEANYCDCICDIKQHIFW